MSVESVMQATASSSIDFDVADIQPKLQKSPSLDQISLTSSSYTPTKSTNSFVKVPIPERPISEKPSATPKAFAFSSARKSSNHTNSRPFLVTDRQTPRVFAYCLFFL